MNVNAYRYTQYKIGKLWNADLRYLEMKLWLNLDDEALKRTKVGLTQQWYCPFRTNIVFGYTCEYTEIRICIRREYIYIYIYIYTYEYIYDPGILREINICLRREYTYIYIYIAI